MPETPALYRPSRTSVTRLEVPDELDGDLVPIARRLERAEARVVGMLPAGRHARTGELSELAQRLARALHVAVGCTAAVIPAPAAWISPDEADEPPDGAASVSPVDPAPLAGLALLTPAAAGDLATAVRRLDEALAEAARFDRVLVDLSGFETVLGDVIVLFDGVVLVAAAGRTREGDLLALHKAVGPELDLGVVVVGS